MLYYDQNFIDQVSSLYFDKYMTIQQIAAHLNVDREDVDAAVCQLIAVSTDSGGEYEED